MKLIALLSWYDEPAWALTEVIGSLGRAGVDHLVAVDGAYALYPEARPQSPGEQAQAILAACMGAGIGCSLHLPRDVWMNNEIEKRTYLFAAGHLVGEPERDWLWVVDADEIITESWRVRVTLEDTELDAADITMDCGLGDMQPIRKLFRCQPDGIWLENNHYTYMTSGGRMLWHGGDPHPFLADAEPMHFVRFTHRQTRSAERIARRERYYSRRRELDVETAR